MNSIKVVFIAFEEFENLGIGYLRSSLVESGFDSIIIDTRDGKEKILKILTDVNPDLVGLSIVYQFNIEIFQGLVSYLRKGGISCHFTAGGQFASLRYKELFEIVPELDSIVRFEGEYTIIELVKCITEGKDWRKVRSIAFRNKSGEVNATPIRPPEKRLDNYPFPLRSPLKEYAFGRKFSTLVAGRGCINNCTYCNARNFYKAQGGPLKRLREPEMVVKEMNMLYHNLNCTVFLFQDDDFPVGPANTNKWLRRFCDEISKSQMYKKVLWKINCRPDEIDYDKFEMMKRYGLFLVFTGIEDGTNQGLRMLNKQMTVEETLYGINVLKNLGIGFDFGFMLFQPQSTYSTIHENLKFLNRLCGDGYTPASFLKMLPLFDTEVERSLIREGRIKGKPGFFDYGFLEESLDEFYNFFEICFLEWLRGEDGLFNITRWARNYLLVYESFYELNPSIKTLKRNIRELTSESNSFLIDTTRMLAQIFSTASGGDKSLLNELTNIRDDINRRHFSFKKRINTYLGELLYRYEFVKLIKTGPLS